METLPVNAPDAQLAAPIPRVIHSCWFGRGAKSKLLLSCAESWNNWLPSFVHREWNEDTFPLMEQPFFKSAYDAKKWAFCSDYARAWALFSQGGIYLDTDVEVRLPLEKFLHHRAFSGFERNGHPFTAVWGSEAGHPWPKAVLDYYDGRVYDAREPTNTATVTELLVERFGIDPKEDKLTYGAEGIVIYPSATFCVDVEACHAVHHFEGSWVPNKESRRPFKDAVSLRYHANRIVELGDESALAELAALIGEQRVFDLALKQLMAQKGGSYALRSVLPALAPLAMGKLKRSLWLGQRRKR